MNSYTVLTIGILTFLIGIILIASRYVLHIYCDSFNAVKNALIFIATILIIASFCIFLNIYFRWLFYGYGINRIPIEYSRNPVEDESAADGDTDNESVNTDSDSSDSSDSDSDSSDSDTDDDSDSSDNDSDSSDNDSDSSDNESSKSDDSSESDIKELFK